MSALLQLKTAYEDCKMSPEEIAEDQGLEVAAVKAGLIQCSAKYRRDCNKESVENDRLNFSDNELEEVNHIIMDVARNAEHSDGTPDYRTRLNAATYVRDDKKGRKEAVKHLNGNNTFNLLQFNNELGEAREFAKKLREKIANVA